MTIHVSMRCDRCGRGIAPDSKEFYLIVTFKKGVSTPNTLRDLIAAEQHLCSDCDKAMEKFMDNVRVEPL
jgi:hypothetical protein